MKHYPNEFLIRNFIKDMKAGDFFNLCAALTHKECAEMKASQIRKVKKYLASGQDSLGNITVLTVKGNVMQLIGSERY